MKKWFPILLLSLYLISATEFGQVLKLPTLIAHCNNHKNLSPEITWPPFFRPHDQHPAKDTDYKKDRKLPWAAHHHSVNLVFVINKVFRLEEKNVFFKQILKKKILSSDHDFYINGYLHSIWQPPREV